MQHGEAAQKCKGKYFAKGLDPLVGVKRDLVSVKRDLVGVKRDLVGVKRFSIRLSLSLSLYVVALHKKYTSALTFLRKCGRLLLLRVRLQARLSQNADIFFLVYLLYSIFTHL